MSPELARELRDTRPVASPELRERVLAVAAEPVDPPRRRFTVPVRRLVLVAVPTAVAAGLAVAVIHGIVNGGPTRGSVSAGSASKQAVTRGPAHLPITPSKSAPAGLRDVESQPYSAAAIPNTQSRLQQYGATLRVQVKNRDDLSDATKHAMRVARLLGGYVASVHYTAPRDGQGSAAIVVRVPVDRVQDAIDEYSGLGTLLAQRVAITDVTKAVEEQAKEIARIQGEIAAIERGGVSADERPRLHALQARLDYLAKHRKATVRRAELARISLGLVTKPKRAAVAASRFHRTLSDAGSVLVRELELLAYALIVAGPLLILGGAAIAAARMRDRRLFDRT
jgi:Domain of unknown function (DUF4349)